MLNFPLIKENPFSKPSQAVPLKIEQSNTMSHFRNSENDILKPKIETKPKTNEEMNRMIPNKKFDPQLEWFIGPESNFAR